VLERTSRPSSSHQVSLRTRHGQLRLQIIDPQLLVRTHRLALSPLVQLSLGLGQRALHSAHPVLLLLVLSLPLLRGQLLVDNDHVRDSLSPLAELQRRLGLGLVVAGRRAADDDCGAGVSSERLLEDAGELGVAIGHVGLGVGQCRDNVGQGR